MDWPAILLSLKLSSLVCGFLLLIGTPIAYWVTFSRWRWKFLVESVVALPIVLPPTVLGFYILVAIGSQSPIGRAWAAWSGHGLAFTFEGLVIASCPVQFALRRPADDRSIFPSRSSTHRGLVSPWRLQVADIYSHYPASFRERCDHRARSLASPTRWGNLA